MPPARVNGSTGDSVDARPSPVDREARTGKKVPAISRDQLRTFLAESSTLEAIRRVVLARTSKKTPKDAIDDMIQEANIAAMTAKWGPRTVETAKGWLSAVTVRAMVNYLNHGGRDQRWLQREQDPDALADTTKVDASVERWLISKWLGRALVGERDQETLEILTYQARSDRTQEEIAAEHGLSVTNLRLRTQQFRRKYGPLLRRRREHALLLAVALVAALSPAAWVISRAIQSPGAAASPSKTLSSPAESDSSSGREQPASAPSTSGSSIAPIGDDPKTLPAERAPARAGKAKGKSRGGLLRSLTRD